MGSAAPCSAKRGSATPYVNKKWEAFGDTKTETNWNKQQILTRYRHLTAALQTVAEDLLV